MKPQSDGRLDALTSFSHSAFGVGRWAFALLFLPGTRNASSGVPRKAIDAIVWGGVAQVRGKPGWLGLLMLIPIVNLAIPAYLAVGPATAHAGHSATPELTLVPTERAASPSRPPAAASDPPWDGRSWASTTS